MGLLSYTGDTWHVTIKLSDKTESSLRFGRGNVYYNEEKAEYYLVWFDGPNNNKEHRFDFFYE